MCLYSKTQLLPVKATEAITCYKVVRRKLGGYISVVRHFVYSVDRHYNEPKFETEAVESDCGYEVNKGFHSYVNLKDAVNFYHKCFLSTSCDWLPSPIVLECTIPKGALYYTGLHLVNGKGEGEPMTYASNELIIKRELKT